MRLLLRVVRLLSLPAMPAVVGIAEGLGLVVAVAALISSLGDPEVAGAMVFGAVASLAALSCAMRAAVLASRADHHEVLRLVVGPGPLVLGLLLNAGTRPLVLFLLPVAGLAAWGAGEGRLSLPVFLTLMGGVCGVVGGLALGARSQDPDTAARWAIWWHFLPYGLAFFAVSPGLAPVQAWHGSVRMDVLPLAASLMLLHVGAALLIPAHRPPPRVVLCWRRFGCWSAVVLAVLMFVSASLPCRLARPQGHFTACKSNLKNVGTALEMYSTDHHGRYPTRLDLLTPGYLKAMPTCPAARKDTYSGGFVTASGPDAYTVVCSGENHRAVDASANYPQYHSVEGILEK